MVMPIFSKSCPHCKNGDVTIEEFIEKTLGTQCAARCFQCGWQKIFPTASHQGIWLYNCITKQKYTHQCKKCQKEITSYTLEGPERCPHCHSITWDTESSSYDPKHLLFERKDTKGRYSPSRQSKNPGPSSLGYL